MGEAKGLNKPVIYQNEKVNRNESSQQGGLPGTAGLYSGSLRAVSVS